MAEINLPKLREDIAKALKSNDSKFVESVTIRAIRAKEIFTGYVVEGNQKAEASLADFSLELLTDLTDHAFNVKEPIVI